MLLVVFTTPTIFKDSVSCTVAAINKKPLEMDLKTESSHAMKRCGGVKFLILLAIFSLQKIRQQQEQKTKTNR